MQFGLNSQSTQTRSTLTGELEDDYTPVLAFIFFFSLEASFIEKSKSPSVLSVWKFIPDDFIVFRGEFDVYW